MNEVYAKLNKCYEQYQKICKTREIDFVPEIALVLGSGLGDYADDIQVVAEIDYHEMEGFPVSTVAGHQGKYILGYVNEVPVVCMKGRVHYYEGYPINTCFKAGDFMMIKDQISSFVPSPLIGPNAEELGVRFPDMSQIYDADLQQILRKTAALKDIPLQEGVYIQLTGPNYESPAEVRMCRTLGADAVGMSTACEAVAANHMGMKICGISCISNMACGITANPLTHQEVQETADRVAPLFKKLVTECITAIHTV